MGRSAAFLGLVALVACGTSGSTSPSTPPPVAEDTVGASGGTVRTPDGELTIDIPSGALPADTKITVTEIAAPAAGAVGKAYEIGPTGTVFEKPVTLSFSYAGVDLAGHDPSELEVSTVVAGAWTPITGDTVDTQARVASGTTLHLSPYGLAAHANGAPHDDAGTSEDGGPASDGGGEDARSGDDAGIDSGTDAGDAGACSVENGAVGSCQNHPPFCTTYPGTTAGTCANNDGSTGYTVLCCP